MKEINLNPKEDFQKAIKLVNSTRSMLIEEDAFFENFEGFTEMTQLFRFTNENISEYYELFNFENKNVLTVIGAGDQALSAIYKGAKKIDVFDVNKLSYYFLLLKKYAIKSLSYEEFLNLFNPLTKQKDIEIIYKKVSQNIDDENVKEFWDRVFRSNYVFYYLFLDTNVSINRVKRNVPYLENEDKYNTLKQKIETSEINYVGGDLIELVNTLNEKYDYINLSNIIDYIEDKSLAGQLYSRIFNNLLNKDGMCMMEYEWYLYACCNDYIGNLFIKYQIEKHTMKSEDIRPSSAYIYKK